jgi:hypothetical protein
MSRLLVHLRWCSVFAVLLLPLRPLLAQSAPPPVHPFNFWLSGGGGIATADDAHSLTSENGTTIVAAGTVQYRHFLSSVRWRSVTAGSTRGWDLGLLGGIGTSPRYGFRGSIAAGLGVSDGERSEPGVTVPVEVQLSWRLRPGLGIGTYAFANFGGEATALGAALVLQVGRF